MFVRSLTEPDVTVYEQQKVGFHAIYVNRYCWNKFLQGLISTTPSGEQLIGVDRTDSTYLFACVETFFINSITFLSKSEQYTLRIGVQSCTILFMASLLVIDPKPISSLNPNVSLTTASIISLPRCPGTGFNTNSPAIPFI
eukprot:gb/GEZJ01004782.1/.p2 GENE.gb/GEZJ01004782.1/~~gb/GEZJ01004782.1/.p2  ORF type:complete len:141 (-),score=8.53 gb/GEZJ01004782.1/:1123-1545(-)